MKTFLKKFYQVFRFLRELVMSLFFILFIILGFSVYGIFSYTQQHTAMQEFKSGALVLNLDGMLVDSKNEEDELDRILEAELTGERTLSKISIFDVIQAIKKATYDDRIKGIVLDLKYFTGGDYASLDYIGEILKEFKEKSSKPIIAIGDQYTQKEYYLASFADEIYLNEGGAVELNGIQHSNLFFKSLLDRIEAKPQIFRVGTYKSAVEPFLRDDMSPEAKQNAMQWIHPLWNNIKENIAKNRQISSKDVLPEPEDYLAKFKQAGGNSALFAKNQKLVTALVTSPELTKILQEKFGKDTEQDYQSIDYFDYITTLPDRFDFQTADIAVINVEGEIALGISDEDSAGSDTIVEQLREARKADNIKGVILRVNSPGGSVLASELISQEIDAIQKAGKPVVTSMGGLAASGGYWISAMTDKIVASKNTLTGSIGIFGLGMNFEKTAANLGIKQDGVETSPLANQSMLKPLSKIQNELSQLSIENGYDLFLSRVSKGRKMSKEAVDKIAQGQVWLGEVALKNGLVDKLGDFETAYDELASLINQNRVQQGLEKVDSFKVAWVAPQNQGLLGRLMKEFKVTMSLNQWFDIPFVEKLKQEISTLPKFNDPKNMYIYCLTCKTVQ